jgi:hypothetical protein
MVRAPVLPSALTAADVAFISGAPNLLPNPPRPVLIPHAFLKDRMTGELRRVSIANDGSPKEGVDSATVIHTAISDDGRFVAFNTFMAAQRYMTAKRGRWTNSPAT